MVEPPRIQINSICKSFGATQALSQVSFSVNPGEVLALLGENGAGKSTLMRILAGVEQPDSGEIVIAGKIYRPQNPLEARSLGVTMVHQELTLAPHLSAIENIFLGSEKHSYGFLDTREMHREASQALAKLGHPNISLTAPIRSLSISERQLVEIARALVHNSHIVIFDEPTSSLSFTDVEVLFQIINRLKQSGISIIYISHFLEEVFRVADSFAILRDGQCVGQGSLKDYSMDHITALLGGKSKLMRTKKNERRIGERLLRVEEVSGPEQRPQQASLEIYRGEVIGLVGLIGSGRSELLKCIFGLLQKRSGRVIVHSALETTTVKESWGAGVGFLSEDRAGEGLALNRSIAENIALPTIASGSGLSYCSPHYLSEQCAASLQRLNVKCSSAHSQVRTLSGGNQQKVALARLLDADVDLFILDEPTRGIDIGSKAQIYEIIQTLTQPHMNSERQRSVLLVSSSFEELLAVCDRLFIMQRGVLTELPAPETLSEHILLQRASGAVVTTTDEVQCPN